MDIDYLMKNKKMFMNILKMDIVQRNGINGVIYLLK